MYRRCMAEIIVFKNQFGNDLILCGLFVLRLISGNFPFDIEPYAVSILCIPIRDAATYFSIKVNAISKMVRQEREE